MTASETVVAFYVPKCCLLSQMGQVGPSYLVCDIHWVFMVPGWKLLVGLLMLSHHYYNRTVKVDGLV